MNYFEVNGYKEKLEAAWKLQEETRAESLFLHEVEVMLCGEPIHPISLKHFQLFTLGDNGFFSGDLKESDALNVIWVLSKRNRGGVFNGMRKIFFIRRVMKWAKNKTSFDPEQVIFQEVSKYLDTQTIDMPGRYGSDRESSGFGFPTTNTYLNLIGDVMSAFPSFGFDELWNMPVSMFFQLLKLSYQKINPEYVGDQPTSEVIRWGMVEYRKLKDKR